MTGNVSSRGRMYLDFESYKNQEWLRRRQLRIEQVRKQTNDIAKIIRKKVVDEEKARSAQCQKMSKDEFRNWKAERLRELEEKLRSALEEFGQGYKEAEEEPNPEEVLEERQKVNLKKAEQRGQIASQEELRKRKEENKRKMSPIERKKRTRKLEDLRSSLIRSIQIRNESEKSITKPQEEHPKEEKVILMKKKEKSSLEKNGIRSSKRKMSDFKKNEEKVQGSCPPLKNTTWVNLNDLNDSSDGGRSYGRMKPFSRSDRSQESKNETIIEFFDYNSRCYSKGFRELPNLVERISSDSEPNAIQLARVEEEKERKEAEKKLVVDAVAQERGNEALRREKVNRDYNNLMTKLEELHKKEKIIKSQQRIPPSLIHMNDERLSERMKTKQRLMDSKFESIYYNATSRIPQEEPQGSSFLDRSGGGDCGSHPSIPIPSFTRLSFSPSNLKTNSPITPEERTPMRTSPEDIRRFKNTPNGLLCDVEKTLREGRQLRENLSRKNSDMERSQEEIKSLESSQGKSEKKTTKSQESQTDDLGQMELKPDSEASGVGLGDDSLPLSTSTSYKSPPSVIRSYRLRQLLDYLESLGESDDADLKHNTKIKRRIKKLLNELLPETKTKHRVRTSQNLPLEYYVEKLLTMSRECVANLSVSSENISTPNITDLDVGNGVEIDSEPEMAGELSPKLSSQGEQLIRQSRLNRAEKLEEAVKNWKAILEKNTAEESDGSNAVYEPDCPHNEEEKKEEEVTVLCSPKIQERYDEITKKCSERIWELSNMLEKVRKDKEKLLSSTSGSSSLCVSKTHGQEEGGEDSLEKRLHPETSPVLESFINRYNLTRPEYREDTSTKAVVDSHSCQNTNESMESWPDVMDELLKRNIISSPFKWHEGEFSELLTTNDSPKPSSIESVIGNFRKEMSKIKPLSLAAMDPLEENYEDVLRSAPCHQDESSVESINHALTSLGLNWAKSFLRKNEESKAITSSSGSSDEGHSSGEEEEQYFNHRKGEE